MLHHDDFTPDQVAGAREAYLRVALKIGALLDDLVAVGGLVPTLLTEGGHLTVREDEETHAGTVDLDIGLDLGLLDSGRYTAISKALRDGGFVPDTNDRGNATGQRWRMTQGATVDFLIPPTADVTAGGRLQNLEPDFAAIVTPGLDLAFRDRARIEIQAVIDGALVSRSVWVCLPGAYTVLKALAFHDRTKDKDAYDLHYVLAHFGDGPAAAAQHLRPLLDHPEAERAVAILRTEFAAIDHAGPAAVARFLLRNGDDALKADVAGVFADFLAALGV